MLQEEKRFNESSNRTIKKVTCLQLTYKKTSSDMNTIRATLHKGFKYCYNVYIYIIYI